MVPLPPRPRLPFGLQRPVKHAPILSFLRCEFPGLYCRRQASLLSPTAPPPHPPSPVLFCLAHLRVNPLYPISKLPINPPSFVRSLARSLVFQNPQLQLAGSTTSRARGPTSLSEGGRCTLRGRPTPCLRVPCPARTPRPGPIACRARFRRRPATPCRWSPTTVTVAAAPWCRTRRPRRPRQRDTRRGPRP